MNIKSFKALISKLPFGIEALFPALMAFALFAAITDVLYSGGRRENLAAQGEKYLIERSLRQSLKPTDHPGSVITISLTDADLTRFEPAPSRLVKDASLAVYARMMQMVAAEEPNLVVVSWLSSAHPSASSYWQILRDALATVKHPENIFVSYPIAEMSSVPKDLREGYNFKEGEDCIYEVNSFCTYNPAWRNWLVQSLAERFWPKPGIFHISKNLPHVLPNFLLNLPTKDSLPNYSFQDVWQRPDIRARLKGAVVFIGNATSQSAQFRDNKSVLRRTFSVENADGSALLANGTPLHVFWAQIAQMFIDGRTVAVTPFPVTVFVLLLLGLAILVVLFRLGSAAGLAFFLTYAALFPLVNDFGVTRFKVYVPMFDVTYGGFLVFLFSTFGFLSFNNLQTWRLQAKRRLFESTADLKGNFISLISHNLNTPIAKLQGLIDVLLSSQQFPAESEKLMACRILVARLLFCVRTVLLTTSLEQHSLSITGSKLNALLKEYEDSVAPTLSRLGIQTNLLVSDEESLFTTFNVDAKIFCHLLGALAAAVSELHAEKIELSLAAERGESFDNNGLSIVAKCPRRLDSGKVGRLLSHFKSHPSAMTVTDEDFLLQALVRFVTAAVKAAGGHVESFADSQSLMLSCTLPSK